jgi:hypothetical protein
MVRDDLVNDAERRLWDAFPTAEKVDLGPGEPADADFDETSWGADRVVRAEVISRLLLGVRDTQRGYVTRVSLSGARISGSLNINGAVSSSELIIERCWLEDAPDFGDATTLGVDLLRCRIAGFAGFRWRCSGGASFINTRIVGPVDFSGARIGGELEMAGATLTNPEGTALNGYNLTVDQGLYCGSGFSATGMVDLSVRRSAVTFPWKAQRSPIARGRHSTAITLRWNGACSAAPGSAQPAPSTSRVPQSAVSFSWMARR